MPEDVNDTSTPAESSETPSPALGDTGRNSMQGALEQARDEQAALDQAARADAAATEGARPSYARERTEGTSEWIDRGIRDVPVDKLPQPEGVSADNFDHHIAYEDAVKAAEEYDRMRPLIDQGLTSEDFAAMDRTAGRDWEHGQQRVYDLFHGSNAVHVTKDGDQYDIIDGRHRIFVAKERGSQTMPARVREHVPKEIPDEEQT